MSRRVNVIFSDQAYRTLEDMSSTTGKSVSELLREAIALKSWFETTRQSGRRILVESGNGSIREVINV